MKSNSKVKIYLIYIYAFMAIYNPNIGRYIGIPSYVYMPIIIGLIFIYYLLVDINFLNKILLRKNVIYLFSGLFLASLYFNTLAAFKGNSVRIFQDLLIFIYLINILFVEEWLNRYGYNKERKFKFLFNLVVIQSVFCILMFIIPSFRQVALDLYYGDNPQNIFINRMRIYGLSSDYTYGTPIFHGMILAIMVVYALFKSKKYFLYIPFVIFNILINGRIGLAVGVVSLVAIYSLLLLSNKKITEVIKSIFVIGILVILGVQVLKYISPNTYRWILDGVVDTIGLITGAGLQGNYRALLDKMLYWPKGISIVFGDGHRVYAEHASQRGYIHSDIGYVNDMFMGGVVYTTLLYGAWIKFIGSVNRKRIKTYIDKCTKISLLVCLVLGNYKGEVFRSTAVLVGIVFIIQILNYGNE